jgi:hypothetical protein
MNAVFREVDQEKDVARMASGQVELGFRDSYYFEPAAYELARILGYDNVPPVVLGRVHGKPGSLQIWMEGTMRETDRLRKKLRPPDARQWNQQVQMMRLFDALVFNTDRNAGNILIDAAWKLWMIDHTRAFRRHDELMNPGVIILVERSVWEKVQSVSDEEIRRRLDPFLRRGEIEGLLKRRQNLIVFVRKLFADRGEAEVLFSLKAPSLAAAQNPN